MVSFLFTHTSIQSIFQLSKLTVAVMKDFVKTHNISSNGSKKADLIDAISTHFGV